MCVRVCTSQTSAQYILPRGGSPASVLSRSQLTTTAALTHGVDPSDDYRTSCFDESSGFLGTL